MRGPSPEREAYWRGIMARQAGSGLNAAQFCQRENVSSVNFYLWKRKLRERDAGGGACGAEPADAGPRTHFLPVQIDSSDVDALKSTIRIRWPSGIQLEVPLAAGRDTLEQLLRWLSQIASGSGERRG